MHRNMYNVLRSSTHRQGANEVEGAYLQHPADTEMITIFAYAAMRKKSRNAAQCMQKILKPLRVPQFCESNLMEILVTFSL